VRVDTCKKSSTTYIRKDSDNETQITNKHNQHASPALQQPVSGSIG
jgi:hypothetical protein